MYRIMSDKQCKEIKIHAAKLHGNFVNNIED